jgi:hypothetical protein
MDASLPHNHVSSPALQQLLCNISQHKLLDLAAPCKRYFIAAVFAEPEHMHWRLVSAQDFPHPIPDLVKTYFVGAFFAKEEGGRDFDVARVRYADDDCAGDGGVFDETFFDFEGVDVFAAWGG